MRLARGPGSRGDRSSHAARSPVVPVTRDRVEEAAGARARSRPAAHPAWSARRAARARRPRASQAASTAPDSSSGRSGTIRPLMPALGELGGEALGAAREERVRVAHQHDRDALGDPRARVEHGADRGAGGERARRRRVDHRTVGQRVAERHAELDEVGARRRRRRADRPEVSTSGKPPIRYGISAARPGAANAAAMRAAPSSRHARALASTSARSLSPRPDRHTRSSVAGRSRRPAAPRRSRARTRAPG